ncbi:MAG: DEAD/DEAH box helicase, partial [Muribaculaceae bacterium]|nr:DEAD/DEAH box helicase [Muribaculaceae bacterium]
MDLSQLRSLFMSKSRYEAIKSALKNPDGSVAKVGLYNLAGSSAAVALSGVDTGDVPMLVIGDSADDAGYLYHDLARLLGDEAVIIFPSGYKRDIKYGQPDPPAQVARTEALTMWQSNPDLKIIVTYPEALAERVATRDDLTGHTITLKLNTAIDLVETEKWLRENGFAEVDYVYEPGQFAVRGSILDIYSYSNELPYRIDFFGDEIDSMRTFNVETQLSVDKIDQLSITANVNAGAKDNGISLLEFVNPTTVIAARDASYTIERIRAIANENISMSAIIADEGDPTAMEHVIDPDRFAADLNRFTQVLFTSSNTSPAGCTAAIDFDCSPQGLYHKNFDLISESFTEFLSKDYKIYILSDSAKQIERLREIFKDRKDDISFESVMPTLHEGFVDHKQKRCIFTDHQIFDRFHKYSLKSDRARSGKLALSLKELGSISVGDYIVHVDHGIGRFAGLVRTDINGKTQEMIKLVYQNDDIIFVSIHSLHKLAKYRGKEGVPPKINKLGTGAWNKMKERTKSHLKDIARDLIKLYAARKDEKGFSFSPDSFMQHELEASFKYEDTPDQLTATQAVKADMESARPMDRLICGDVGFGKTEIAIRAAFKAAADGKQTAVLVPTTVLAYQHYNTFKKRLKDFPVKVDY